MKNSILLFLLFLSGLAYAQQPAFEYITEDVYNQRKVSGTLNGTEVVLSPGMVNPNDVKGGITFMQNYAPEKATGCSGYFDPPGPALNVTFPDDGWVTSSPLTLPFNFCFFGDIKTQVWINNNGNISFNAGISAFSSSAFPSTGNQMIAAFWADFDFGGGGTIHATLTPTALIVNWVNVGYFSSQGDKRNTCQIVITDGTDPLIINGNVAIHYADMQWTTGSASAGVGGFGGTPATAGANRGNNIDYFTIGRFDHAGTDYDGPAGSNDGVSFLDNKSYFFDFCNVTSGNIDPIPLQTAYCDTLSICSTGDTLLMSFPFLSPENNQVTTVTYSAPTLNNVQVVSNNAGEITLQINGDDETPGIHYLTVTGTDNFSTPGDEIVTYTIEIFDAALAFPTPPPTLQYTPACSSVNLGLSSVINYDNILWSNGATTPMTAITPATDGLISVVVENNGCELRIDSMITVPVPPAINLVGNPFYCPAANGSTFYISDSTNLGGITWGLTDPSLDSLFINFLPAGSYTITITDTSGICQADTSIVVSSQPLVQLQANLAICVPTHTFTTNTGGGGSGVWTTGTPSAGTAMFNNPNALNTTVTLPQYGTYNLVYTDATCGDDDTVTIIYGAPPTFNFTNDFFVCPGDLEHMYISDSLNMSSVSWGATNPTTLYSADLGIGTHTVTLVSEYGCQDDTTFTIVTQLGVDIDDITQVCGDTLEFGINTGIQTGLWTYYNSAGVVNFRDDTDLNTGLDVSEYGVYNLIFTEPTCLEADTVTINFIPYPYVDLNDSTELCEGQFVDIAANVYYPGFVTELYWNTGATTSTINTGLEGEYFVTIENQCGTYSDSIIATVKICDFELPNVFTPNGDPTNGTWKLLPVGDIFKEFSCVIVNRWGTVVYEFDGPKDEWDGKDRNGNEVGDGVYFYTIAFKTLGDRDFKKQGFIHLQR